MSFNVSIDEEPAITDPLAFMLESLQEDSGTSKAAAHSPSSSSDSLPAEVPSETDEDADDIPFSPRRQPTSTAGQYPSPQESQTNATYENTPIGVTTDDLPTIPAGKRHSTLHTRKLCIRGNPCASEIGLADRRKWPTYPKASPYNFTTRWVYPDARVHGEDSMPSVLAGERDLENLHRGGRKFSQRV
ncbi:hypothetical protein BJX68DRAFT_263450 [Aspergillus pseudodeflectus]|uniref:Uncharacterized protein n=1 Tax=Aspergillus pseudodeflectus TaxID=176178 RepID=A0ABR4KXB3_9EURO